MRFSYITGFTAMAAAVGGNATPVVTKSNKPTSANHLCFVIAVAYVSWNPQHSKTLGFINLSPSQLDRLIKLIRLQEISFNTIGPG